MKVGEKEAERPVRDNGGAAFINLRISMWEGGTDGEMDLEGEREGTSYDG